ncbi:transposase, IS608 family protein [Scytonema sp. HK-05]|nr:transposase, IS608 family protein [Scytonema sp. HK-05]
MHRDLMSAYLSRFVNQDDTLLLQDARNGYCGAESLLLEAFEQQSKNRKQVGDAESRLIPLERFSDKLKNVDQIANSNEFGQQVNANFQPESPNF